MGVHTAGFHCIVLHSTTVKNKCKSKLLQTACYFSFETSQKPTTKANTADFVAINHVFITMCLLNNPYEMLR